MEAIIHNSHKSVFVPSLLVYIWNDQPLPLKSQMFVSIAWGKGRRGMAHADPSGSWAMFCFWSERQLNNIGHAYFYLMGVAFYTYSSFHPGRLQWTNFVSWGRNILHCFCKKAVRFRSPGTKFLTKNKFSFQFITSLAKFRRHIRCTEIFVAFQLAFESRCISCRRFSLSIHTLIYTHIFSTFEKEWFNRFGIPIGSLGYLGHVPLWKIIAQQQTLSLQGNYVMENWENSSSLRTSRQQVRKTYLNTYLANDKLTLTKT